MGSHREIYYLPQVRLGWDLDGVIGDFSPHYLSYLGFEDQSPATDWYDPRFREHLHKVANDREFWVTMPTIFDPRMIATFPFTTACYVTARAPEKDITREWLWKIGAPYAPLESLGVGGYKVPALKKHEVTVYVDDSIKNFEEINDAGILTYLMTRSHNKGYNTTLRVNNVDELVNVILHKFG